MKKIILSAMILSLFVFSTGCGTEISDNTSQNIPAYNSQTVTSQSGESETTTSESAGKAEEKTIVTPDFEYTEAKNPDKKVTLKITTDLENVEKIKIYKCSANSKDKKNAVYRLVGQLTPDEITSDKSITVKVGKKDKVRKVAKDNSAIKVGYSTAGYRICAVSGKETVWSEFRPYKTTIDTGTIYQYNADFEGFTACGASNGVLVIQPADPVYDQNMLDRFNGVRNYSKISTKYSGGKKLEYCMVGDQVVNSVNDYLKKKGKKYSVKNFDDVGGEPSDIVRELIDTGRPAMFDVQYRFGKIRTKSPYSHWITVNGYKISADGKSYIFRWENTIEPVDSQWVRQSLFNKAVQGTVDNRDFSYYNLTEKQVVKLCGEIKRNIVALSKPLVNSFI